MVGRRAGSRTSAEHPGTAVWWEDRIFEVVEALARPHGGMRYRLILWPDRHTIRVVQSYDETSEQKRGIEQKQRAAAIRGRRLSILLAPLAGHLPAQVQKVMEGDFGASARGMTIASAFPLFLLGGLRILEARVVSLGGGDLLPSWLQIPVLLAAYLVLESSARFWTAFVLGEPMGSLAGVFLYEVRRLAGGRKARCAAAPAWIAKPPPWGTPDRYKMLEPLLALLSPDEQELLERRFGFPILRWGRITALFLAAIGGLNLVISMGMLAQGRDTFWDFAWLLAGGYLCVEQAFRLRRIRQGRPAGSALGGLVRPAVRRLLTSPPGN